MALAYAASCPTRQKTAVCRHAKKVGDSQQDGNKKIPLILKTIQNIGKGGLLRRQVGSARKAGRESGKSRLMPGCPSEHEGRPSPFQGLSDFAAKSKWCFFSPFLPKDVSIFKVIQIYKKKKTCYLC